MSKIKQQYVLVGGWSYMQPGGAKQVVLYRGNRYGEELVRVLKRLDSRTSYGQACEIADALAKELGVRVGRKFNNAEWNGDVEAVGDYVPTPDPVSR